MNMTNNQTETTQALIPLLDEYLDEVAAAWAALIYLNASFHPGDTWLEELVGSTTYALRTIVEALTTGSYVALKDYLTSLMHACLRSGFENGEVTEALLLCKDALLPLILKTYSTDSDLAWSALSDLNAISRWMVVQFNTLYATETNRHLRAQHEHIVSMLKIGEKSSDSVNIDEVLHQVAEGIMAAIDVEHCDFYLIDESQTRAVAKVGVSRTPHTPEAIQSFLDNPPNLNTDGFYCELMERKKPLITDKAQDDPRVNQTVVQAMGAKTVLAVPLVANDRVLAVAVTGTFRDYRAFTEEQIEMAWDIARAATLVIENTKLHQQIRCMAAIEERARLAREFHDNVAQSLSILKLQASHIEDLLHRGENEQVQEFVVKMKKTATEAHADTRDAIFSLRHSASTVSEFQETLRTYVDRYCRTYEIETELVLCDKEAMAALPTDAVIQLPRIIQEALTNVRKHASASAVRVLLEKTDHHFTVTVEDNGQGFDSSAILSKDCGVGLQIMRERAESLSGHLEVNSTPGRGTRIIVQVPLPERR
jgi:signal transduction histidine kinase/plasmid stabilization system protein ParE